MKDREHTIEFMAKNKEEAGKIAEAVVLCDMRSKLMRHRGHNLECVSYGDWSDPHDVCIECVDCNEVLVSAEDFESEGSTVSEVFDRDCPGESHSFNCMQTFDIGFINPEIVNLQGDGIANDETQLSAESVEELEEVYENFCRENKIPANTVKYVESADDTYFVTYAIEGRVSVEVSKSSGPDIENILSQAEYSYMDIDWDKDLDVIKSRPVVIEHDGEIIWEE